MSSLFASDNADAPCRITEGETRDGRREGVSVGAVTVHAACTEDPIGHWGHGTRGGRTPNMLLMLVTLDVSRLSGWLNADAVCRATTEAHGGRRAEREARGRVGAVAVHAGCTEDPIGPLGGTARARGRT